MKLNLNPIKGTSDYRPKEARERELVRQKILSIYQKNGYQLVKTPVLEHLELLSGSEGGDNLRLMFKTVKRGEKLDLSKPNLSLDDLVEEGLRYDLTVPLARFYSNNREYLPNPFKSIQIDEAFRAERPQRGRSREFVQCDIDVFGDSTVAAEIELLSTVFEAYAALGFESLTIRVSDKRILTALMQYAGIAPNDFSTVAVSIDKIADIGVDGVAKELLAKQISPNAVEKLLVAISKIQKCGEAALVEFGVDKSLVDGLNSVISTSKKIGRLAIEALKLQGKAVDAKNFDIVFDISIVRGQGYYTGTVFEAYTQGFARAIGGGGRYDKMVEKLTGQPVSAVGFSMGFEPITMLLRENGKLLPARPLVALIYENEPLEDVLAQKQLLKQKFDVSVFKRPKNMKAALEKLKQNGFSGYLFFGKNEIVEL